MYRFLYERVKVVRGCQMRCPDRGRLLHLAVAFAAAVAVTGCATGPPRTEAERTADDALTVRVEQALLADSTIYARHIDVDSTRGVVHLSGLVWSSNDLYEARRVAAAVPGVTAVVDQLELVVGGRSGAR
jgi:osmotically-inducible protein OsmY